MASLPAEHRRFVIELALAAGNVTKAFTAAGLAGGMSAVALRSAGHRLVHSEAVRGAVVEWSRANIEVVAPRMIAKMIALATGAKSESEQRKSASRLLELAGLNPPAVQIVEHKVSLSYDAKLSRLRELCELNGHDAEQVIASLAPRPAEDAEYEEVPT